MPEHEDQLTTLRKLYAGKEQLSTLQEKIRLNISVANKLNPFEAEPFTATAEDFEKWGLTGTTEENMAVYKRQIRNTLSHKVAVVEKKELIDVGPSGVSMLIIVDFDDV